MIDRLEPDGETQSPRSSNLAARLRSPSFRTAIAAACAALGAAAIYFSELIVRLMPYGTLDLGRFEASLALWPAGMILILIALLVQPPGRARVYTRSAFVLIVVALVLAHIFEFNYSFPDVMGWWYDWYPDR